MIGHQHPRRLQLSGGQIVREFPDVVKKAGALQNDGFAVLLHQKDLIVDGVLGLVGVKPGRAEVIHMHLALGQLDVSYAFLFIANYLLGMFRRGSPAPVTAS